MISRICDACPYGVYSQISNAVNKCKIVTVTSVIRAIVAQFSLVKEMIDFFFFKASDI